MEIIWLCYYIIMTKFLRSNYFSNCWILPYVTIFREIDYLRASTEIPFLPVLGKLRSCSLPRNTKCLTIDGQACFYRCTFADAVQPWGCISWPWEALIGLHGVPKCSYGSLGPPCGLYQFMSNTEGSALLIECKWLF